MASSSLMEQRTWLNRATETKAAQRAREKCGISRTQGARRFDVDTATFYRWETGQRVPTHGTNLTRYVRWLKSIGVDDDPAMQDSAGAAEVEGRTCAEAA